MEKEKWLSLGSDVVCLARAALHEMPLPKEKILKMDLEGIQRMARYHSMDAIVYLSLKQIVDQNDEEINGKK